MKWNEFAKKFTESGPGRPKSKKVIEAEAAAALEKALETPLESNNKGARIMSKMGYKSGMALGVFEEARKEPIRLPRKDDRGGIGYATEKKRKFMEESGYDGSEKRAKITEEQFRSYQSAERKKTRL